MYSVVLLCAGRGTRTGLDYNKMLFSIQGKTIYEMTLDIFLKDTSCQQIIVVTQPLEREAFQRLSRDSRILFVNGGKERQDSVYAGLQATTCEYVFIHDGARPYLKQDRIHALLEGLKEHQACLLMVPCKDTIKRVENGRVVETLNRLELMQAQTPQAFHRDIILEAYQKGIEAHFMATDDAQMVEKFTDVSVYVVEGDYENKKITTPEDLK